MLRPASLQVKVIADIKQVSPGTYEKRTTMCSFLIGFATHVNVAPTIKTNETQIVVSYEVTYVVFPLPG